MFGTNLNIFQHVLKILEIQTEGQRLLIYKGNNYVSNLIHTNHKTYQFLVENIHYKFFMVDIDQILVFKKGHHTTFIWIPTTTEYSILYKSTEQEWGRIFNAYITKNLQNPSPSHIYTRSLPYIEDTKITVVLEDILESNRKLEDRPKYQINLQSHPP